MTDEGSTAVAVDGWLFSGAVALFDRNHNGHRDQHERCGHLQPWPWLWRILFPLGQGGFELAGRLWPLRRIR